MTIYPVSAISYPILYPITIHFYLAITKSISSSLSCLTGEVRIQGSFWRKDNQLRPRHSDRLAHVAPPGGRLVRNRVQVVGQSQICRLVHDIGLMIRQQLSKLKEIMFKNMLRINFCMLVQGEHSFPAQDCVLVHAPQNKTELLFWCRRNVRNNVNGHPVCMMGF